MTSDEQKPKPRTSRKRSMDRPPEPAATPKKTPARKRTTAPRTRQSRKDADEPLSVLMVTSEAHPFAKTGGLAEVSAALSDALGRLGHRVTLVLPRYRGIDVQDATPFAARIRLGRLQPVTLYERPLSDRVTVALVDAPDLFDREALYGTRDGDYADNGWRFAVFSRAALEYARLKEWRPSVIHAHDWQAGLVPVFQKMQLSGDRFVGGVPTVFTLHNLAFQGLFPATSLSDLALGPEVLDVQGLEFWGNISYLKGGINFSEKITTVSPGYAREIVQPELGFGFEGVLARRSADLVGILNGIDTSRWTPTADPFVPASFSADDLRGKRDAKRALLATAGLPADEEAMATPVVGIISRLTDQKGFDLIAAAADELMSLDARWVMLGNGEPRYEGLWRSLAARHPSRVSAATRFDERLAHHIEAGSDMFLMPSRFEPCGLNQMYSLRYGTVPIVRATGGLNDTVEDVDVSPSRGTGFKFRDYTPQAMVQAVSRALTAFKDVPAWKAIQQRGMRQDHSWDASAAEYVKVYKDMTQDR
jgi:starch synthase